MKCPRCHQDNPAHAKFCLECGTSFTRTHANDPQGQSYADLQHALSESLAQQTATSEILRVISSSPTDVQPVFDAIAANAQGLCRARTSVVYTFDGELIHVAAAPHSPSPEAVESLRRAYPMPPGRGGATGRAVLSRTLVYIPNIREDPDYRLHALAKAADYLSVLAVPMLHESKPIGVITLTGADVDAFSERQIALLKTFANQAEIAIENVRLFKELQAKNHDLTEALEQQTSTAEILRVISSSPTDIQPVFDAIAERAMHLCGASAGAVGRFDGELIHVVALANVRPEAAAAVRSVFPMPPSRRSAAARAVLTGGLVHIPDILEDPEYAIATQTRTVFRSVVSVPMLHEGKPSARFPSDAPSPGRSRSSRSRSFRPSPRRP
jgi:two-component system NtrC family sensor kinase